MEQITLEQKTLICQAPKKHKVVAMCKECETQVNQKDKCICRPHLCYWCCNCGIDCDLCNCAVKSNKS